MKRNDQDIGNLVAMLNLASSPQTKARPISQDHAQMTPRELNDARHNFGLGRRDFGRIMLGFTGDPKNIWLTVKRWENGERAIPENIARLVQLLVWFKEDHGYLPDLDAGTRGPLRIPEKWEVSDA